MKLKPLRTEEDYTEALTRLEKIFDSDLGTRISKTDLVGNFGDIRNSITSRNGCKIRHVRQF